MIAARKIDWSVRPELSSLKLMNRFAKHPIRSGFRVIAATAVIVGAVMNLASITAPF